jgi:hypothetical protein
MDQKGSILYVQMLLTIVMLQVDAGQVDMLRNMIQGDDYKEKLGGIVSQLYKLAFKTYHDIPRGPIKVTDDKAEAAVKCRAGGGAETRARACWRPARLFTTYDSPSFRLIKSGHQRTS